MHDPSLYCLSLFVSPFMPKHWSYPYPKTKKKTAKRDEKLPSYQQKIVVNFETKEFPLFWCYVYSHDDEEHKFMFFRGMKINKNYENQLFAFGSVLEKWSGAKEKGGRKEGEFRLCFA